MDRKKTTVDISEEDITAFKNALKNVRPIKQDKVLLKKKPVILKRPPPELLKAESPPVYLSEHNFEKIITSEQQLFFTRSGLPAKQIKQLKKGRLAIAARLDLHGCDAESAKSKLLNFLEDAYLQHKRCVHIIHGKGHSDKPILKNKLNHWLKQLDWVLAFSTALPKDGGAGALYVLLRRY
jgi:DNA-nicking Smr family endonuclease